MRVFFDHLSDIPQTKLTSFEQFMGKIKKVHPEYKIHGIHGDWATNRTKLLVECPVHGRMDRWRNPHYPAISTLTMGRGCSKCAGNYRKTTGDFIEESQKIHGSKYDYSKTVYIKDSQKVVITCHEHGDFEQAASSHLQGMGCSKCGHYGNSNEPKSKKEFVRDAVAKYGDWFDYSFVRYQGNKEPVIIFCELHGSFEKSPNMFLRQNSGCSECAKMKRSKKGNEQLGLMKDFIKKAREVHGAKYKYTKGNFVDNYTPICVTCRDHGDFWVTPHQHTYKKEGCKVCR